MWEGTIKPIAVIFILTNNDDQDFFSEYIKKCDSLSFIISQFDAI